MLSFSSKQKNKKGLELILKPLRIETPFGHDSLTGSTNFAHRVSIRNCVTDVGVQASDEDSEVWKHVKDRLGTVSRLAL